MTLGQQPHALSRHVLLAALPAAIAALLILSGPAHAAHVHCGQVLVASTTLDSDLLACPGDGLVVGANRITIDLNGHTLAGAGVGAGIRNDGFDGVTIRSGTVQGFLYGVQLNPGTLRNVVAALTLTTNERGVLLEGASGNRLLANTVASSSDAGIILLPGSNSNLVHGNAVSLSQDAAFIVTGSHDNRIERNTITQNGDSGVRVTESNGSLILENTISASGDSGIFLEFSNGSVIRGNDVRFNTGGIELTSSNGNRVELNNASNTLGIGIELQDSLGNSVVLNVANSNGAQGIHVEALAELPGAGNLIDCNTTNENLGDGIVVASPVHTIRANIANLNDGWGIYAAIGNMDGGANDASGNSEPAQCFGVFCGPAPRECAVPPPPPPASPSAGRTLQQAGQRCRIPNVRGRTLRGARRAIVRAGCRVGTVKSRYSAARKGRVISQSPRGGRRVRRGFRVNLSLSKGVRAARVRAARPPFTG